MGALFPIRPRYPHSAQALLMMQRSIADFRTLREDNLRSLRAQETIQCRVREQCAFFFSFLTPGCATSTSRRAVSRVRHMHQMKSTASYGTFNIPPKINETRRCKFKPRYVHVSSTHPSPPAPTSLSDHRTDLA